MRNPQERARRPEIILQDLLRRHAKGQLLDSTENVQPFMRAVVLAVDTVGGRLSNPVGSGGLTVDDKDYKAVVGPENPQNSIKARVLTRGFDRYVVEQEARIFWPLLQNDHMSIPIKPGEHVYVMFEDQHYEHGMWLCKVPGHVGANRSLGLDSYSAELDRKAIDAFERSDPESIDESRAGDFVQQRNLNELF